MKTIYYSNVQDNTPSEIEQVRDGSWVHVVAPTDAELQKLSKDHNLDLDLLKDAIDLYESPRVERDDGTVYVFTRYYHPDNGVINATEPLLIVHQPNLTITIQRVKSPVLSPLIEGKEEVITIRKAKTVLQILQAVNSSYAGYVTRATRTILSARSQLKQKDISNEVLLGFAGMEDDLNEFLSTLEPQTAMLRNLLAGKYIRLYEEDKDLIEDLTLNTNELKEQVNSRLKTIVTIRQSYDAITASELNRTFRRLTTISIFMMIPTIASGLYGMNVRLPFAESPWAFWLVVLFIAAMASLLFYVFQRKRWL